jgi:hypothetical protein
MRLFLINCLDPHQFLKSTTKLHYIISPHIELIAASCIVFIVTSALAQLLWTIAAEVDFIVALFCLLGFG